MSVIVHKTPNPNALKFVLSDKRFPMPLNFSSAEAAAAHPLAAELFTLEGVYNVFLAQDFVTVNKRPDAPWESLVEQVESVIARQQMRGDF